MSKIKNLDKLLAKLDATGENAAPIARIALAQGLQLVKARAKSNCKVDTGNLRNSIHSRSRIKGKIVEGEVYTNNDHAVFVEFGTGPVGAASPKDIPKGLHLAYKPTGWWIHVGDKEGDISPATVKRHNLATITTATGETFVFTKGQPAKPYLYPALKESEKDVVKVMSETIQQKIREAVRRG